MNGLFYGNSNHRCLQVLNKMFPMLTFQVVTNVEDLLALPSEAVFVMTSQLTADEQGLLIDYYAQVVGEKLYVIYDGNTSFTQDWIITPSESRIEMQVLQQSRVDRNHRILIGKTKHGGKIWVCCQCNAYDTPHFTYQYKRHASVDLVIHKAEILDSSENLDLKYRHALKHFFRSENWSALIQVWNFCNAKQIPANQHVPAYVNLCPCRNIAMLDNPSTKAYLRDAILFIEADDDEISPHFHYQRSDGSETAISLLSAIYLATGNRPLNPQEIEMLIACLSAKHEPTSAFGEISNYQFLLWLWNDQNGDCLGKTNAHANINDKHSMPEYSLLATYKSDQQNDP